MRATLTYHSIDGSGSAVSVSPGAFADHLRWLTSGAVQALPLDGIAGASGAGADAVAITFDDGFANARPAIEQLLERGIAPTIFVVSGHAGGTNAWGGRSDPGIPTLPLLSWSDLEALVSRGANVEAHTRTHPRLSAIGRTQQDDELGGCREDLKSRLGVTSTHIAYPYGDVTTTVTDGARACFSFGHTTALATRSASDHAMLLPRLDMYYFQSPGSLDGWGSPAFERRLKWLRVRRRVGALVRR